MQMTLETCRRSLIGVWGLGFLIPLILIFVQAVAGKYGGKFPEVLGWLTSLTLPTILLMIGVMVANPAGAISEDKKTENKIAEENAGQVSAKTKTEHETFIFRIAAVVSILYLLIINFVFFIEPLSNLKPQDLMRDYKIFLAGFDSLISLLIGYFFGKK
jgi:1,4-dihydroxy-2-naphthoate octaprenyltransferase